MYAIPHIKGGYSQKLKVFILTNGDINIGCAERNIPEILDTIWKFYDVTGTRIYRISFSKTVIQSSLAIDIFLQLPLLPALKPRGFEKAYSL